MDTIQVDASTIAIVCWKGRTNLCILVSQLDAQELLERLSARFGCERVACRNEEKNADLMDEADEPVDQKLGEPIADGQAVGESDEGNH